MNRIFFNKLFFMVMIFSSSVPCWSQDFDFQLRSQNANTKTDSYSREHRTETWPANKSAMIICDVWDAHHCLNAVKRLEEMLPRMNEVVQEARRRGATIIHAPSDCMDAYADHPSRRRAVETPRADNPPLDLNWCSKIPAEEAANYPIDQSDGGEDDDPEEHAAWAKKLTAQGRNPKMPWKAQNDKIKIDAQQDYISDRGDEVWNILEANGIENVILVGVHTNMCVLGRPFGLRQMVRNGKRTCLMRDMTDCMYNPARHPFVDHFTGNDLIVSHVERFVCPTITSDQILGGKPFRFTSDQRAIFDIQDLSSHKEPPIRVEWTKLTIGSKPIRMDRPSQSRKFWYRCALRIDSQTAAKHPLSIRLPNTSVDAEIWIDGHVTKPNEPIPTEYYASGDAMWLMICLDTMSAEQFEIPVPALVGNDNKQVDIAGNWETRWDDAARFDTPSLPAKFGASPDFLITPRLP
jgi:nicotinamidase-related amidase